MAKSSRSTPAQVSRLLAEFAHDIKRARVRRGISVRSMAEKLGVSTSTYSRLEKGENVSTVLTFSTLWVLGLLPRFSGIIAPETDLEAIRLETLKAEQRHQPKRGRGKNKKIEDMDF